MITLVRHGVEPMKIHAAIADMEKEAAAKLKTGFICRGSTNTNDPEFNKNKDHALHLLSVSTSWEEAPPPPEPELPLQLSGSKKGGK